MSQTADIQLSSIEDILKILRLQAQSMPHSATSVRYLRALDSFQSSVMGGRFDYAHSGNRKRETENAFRASLVDWLVNLWLMNFPFSTASLYLDIISSLYGAAVKAGRLPKTDLFSDLKTQLKTLGPSGWKKGIDDEIFARALRLTRNSARLLADDAIAADLVIWSLTHALQPLEQIAMMKRSDYRVAGLSQGEIDKSIPSEDLRLKTEDLAIFSNLSLNTNARRVYIFPLRQSQRTLSQLKKHIAKIVNALFKRARLPQATDPFHTVEALWAYAALRVGVPASVLVSHLGHAPLGLPVLKLCKSSVFSIQSSDCGKAAKDDLVGTHGSSVSLPSDSSNVQRPTSNKKHTAQSIDTSNCEANTPKYTEPSAPILRSQYCSAAEDLRLKTQDLAAIGRVFLDNPPRWYAMSLRPGVLFTQVCRRIQLLSSGNGQRTTDNAPLANTARSADTSLSDIELFYPCEEIARAIGKKIVIRERPFIHSVVFFRAKLTDIGPLFARIGDLAWCYRQSSRSGAPYADISERQFQLFQQTIAQFTPDYEVASTGELELRPNDRVQILGGLFAGHEATFEESRVKGQESSISASENGKQKTENANASGVVYRLNIIGDNGIEWRISVDSRLATPK